MGPFLHPRPEFYKHEFCLFTLEADIDAPEYFQKEENWLFLLKYRQRTRNFDSEEDFAVAHGTKRPRRGEATPLDEDHPKWEGTNWAPPLNGDPDPMTEDGYR